VAQHEPRHPVGQLSGELGAAPSGKEVHHRQVVVPPTRGLEGLAAAAGDLHGVSLPAEHQGQRLGVSGIVFDEQDRATVAHR
jgi:hypothetical protein